MKGLINGLALVLLVLLISISGIREIGIETSESSYNYGDTVYAEGELTEMYAPLGGVYVEVQLFKDGEPTDECLFDDVLTDIDGVFEVSCSWEAPVSGEYEICAFYGDDDTNPPEVSSCAEFSIVPIDC